MYLTEEEAKEKWCPFVRIDEGETSVNRQLSGYDRSLFNCIASECACWAPHFQKGEPPMGRCGLIRSELDVKNGR